ncbi:MAG: 23S rRNA (adenine(2503)-C(2))-methyltransferase RlmN [Acidobacteria bacterium]|nr:23S rRNA (adenine(2503)-C(2))-methyltransferase RlmN [Acidobacteriota bacterium]MCI0628395.1 23S rRNA (adenine(2503)-C(2))-methyltransferase RlmN [Acidobacteriota bacterium]MCI0721776.1 23S rRNA (adenine(2503)-C(2))-methyltransferase RlmN [Acidobacteriota bacterium]
MEVQRRELLGLTSSDLCQLLESLGEKPFHGKQIYYSIYKLRQFQIGEMTELSRALRGKLQQCSRLTLPQPSLSQLSVDGTRKYLFELADGKRIESVFIPEEQRNTLCISTQVGCPMDCKFCLTALIGLARNLTAGEIAGQVLSILKDQQEPLPEIAAKAKRSQNRRGSAKPVNIVLMGMGEPLLNLENVSRALVLMADPGGIGIPPHRITLSTVGLAPKILDLAKAPVVPNLAISLSATTDDVRDQLMPVNRKYPIHDLIQACEQFPLRPRQRLTFEYVLIDSINDLDQDARRLVRLLSRLRAKVNLLPLNPGQGNGMRPSSPERVRRFQEILASKGLAAYIRRPRGADIFAACGQLHHAQQPLQMVH